MPMPQRTLSLRPFFIGGVFTNSVFFVENQVTKLNLEFQLFTNANLCLLARGPDLTLTKCLPLDTAGPYSLIAIWDRANDAPAGQL